MRVVFTVTAALVALSVWLEFGVLGAADPPAASTAPDYFITDFTATGVDADGKTHQLRAARLVHRGGEATLTAPRIVQYRPDRRIAADSGTLAGGEVLLTGNVRVTQGGSVTTADTMLIRL